MSGANLNIMSAIFKHIQNENSLVEVKLKLVSLLPTGIISLKLCFIRLLIPSILLYDG